MRQVVLRAGQHLCDGRVVRLERGVVDGLGPELVDVRLARDLHVGLGLGACGLVALPLVDAQAARLLADRWVRRAACRRRLLLRSSIRRRRRRSAPCRPPQRCSPESVVYPCAAPWFLLGLGVSARANIPGVARGVQLATMATLFVLSAAACGGGGGSADGADDRESAGAPHRSGPGERGSGPRRRRPFARCAGRRPGRRTSSSGGSSAATSASSRAPRRRSPTSSRGRSSSARRGARVRRVHRRPRRELLRPRHRSSTRSTSAGRAGYFVRGASCGCHRESPILVTVVSQRARVSWLLVNGPGATRARAQALAAQMP